MIQALLSDLQQILFRNCFCNVYVVDRSGTIKWSNKKFDLIGHKFWCRTTVTQNDALLRLKKAFSGKVVFNDIVPMKIGCPMEGKIIKINEEFCLVMSRRLGKLREPLTPSERRVFDIIKSGKTSKECAQELYISIHTVNIHRRNILKKGVKFAI